MAPGVQFSEEKQSKIIAPISIGEGILGKNDPSPPKESRYQEQSKANKNIDKANSLLDELSREERSGIKAEFTGLDNSEKSQSMKDRDDRTNSALTDKSKKQKSDLDDNYEDEFEEIDEDLPENDLDMSHNMGLQGKIGESHGITVSQSLGIDPSVDSLALEDYDHIEPVEKLN